MTAITAKSPFSSSGDGVIIPRIERVQRSVRPSSGPCHPDSSAHPALLRADLVSSSRQADRLPAVCAWAMSPYFGGSSSLTSLELLHLAFHHTLYRTSRRLYHLGSLHARHIRDRLLVDGLVELIAATIECFDVLVTFCLVVRVAGEAGLNSACWI